MCILVERLRGRIVAIYKKGNVNAGADAFAALGFRRTFQKRTPRLTGFAMIQQIPDKAHMPPRARKERGTMSILYSSYARSATHKTHAREYLSPSWYQNVARRTVSEPPWEGKSSYLPKLCTAAASLSYTSKTVMSLVTCSTSLNFAPRLQSLSVPPCDRAL